MPKVGMLGMGIDSGGTFTDVVAVASDGRWMIHKELNGDGPARAVLTGIQTVLDAFEVGWPDISWIIHGTTIGTNTILTRTGASVALLTTRGFRDTLELRRGRRKSLYGNHEVALDVLVRRSRRYEIDERTDSEGRIITELDPESIRSALNEISKDDVGSVAICFMNSYKAPGNEVLAAEYVNRYKREHGCGWHVSCSHEVSPQIGFFERCSTAVIDAYVGPTVTSYLGELEEEFRSHGFAGQLRIMQANAGSGPIRTVRKRPAAVVNSGPTGAAHAGALVITELGQRSCVTLDMGGTSTDISLVVDGIPCVRDSTDIAGLWLQLPAVEVVTIGAGGGSVAHRGRDGLLRIGPESAGAQPGPACYGRGGTLPTVTDANVLIGLLGPEGLAGGQLRISRSLAEQAMGKLAEEFESTPIELAEHVFELANQGIVNAVREATSYRGFDPQRLPLICGGGAGPIHACEVARGLGSPLVVIPRAAGVLSAWGLVQSRPRHDGLRPFGPVAIEDVSDAALIEGLRELTVETIELNEGKSGLSVDWEIQWAVDARYEGQLDQLPVPVREDMRSLLAEIRSGFRREHLREFGYAADDDPLELTQLRSTLIGPAPRLEVSAGDAGSEGDNGGTWGVLNSDVTLVDGSVAVIPLSEVGRDRSRGPRLVRDKFWTAWIPSDFDFWVDDVGNLLAELVR